MQSDPGLGQDPYLVKESRLVKKGEINMEQPQIPSWRQLGPQDQEDFMTWFRVSMEERNEIGEKRYHSLEKGFQGDPFTHLGEEILDSVKYFWVELRRLRQDPFYAIYRALHALLEKENAQDIEEVLSVNGITFRMNAIRGKKPKTGYEAIAMNIRLTQIPAPDVPSTGDASMDSSVSEKAWEEGDLLGEDCLGMIFLEEGSEMYRALQSNQKPDGHTTDCEVLRALRNGDCSSTCVMTVKALKAWEGRPAPAPSRKKSTDIRLAGTGPEMPGQIYLNLSVALMEQGAKLYSALRKALRPSGHSQDCHTNDKLSSGATYCSLVCKLSQEAIKAWDEKAGMEYLGTVTEVMERKEKSYTEARARSNNGCPHCKCPSPDVDHGDALLKLSQDEADRLDKR